MYRTTAFLAAALIGTFAARAQSAPATGASAAAAKIGVLSVRQAIVNTAEGKQASAELQSQFAPRQNELEALNKQINDIRQRLQTSDGKLAPEEQTRLTRQGESLAKQAQRKQ